jgi:pantoate kinase
MEKASVAFCPGHISGYFFPVKGATPKTTGSLGAGIVIDEGVTSVVRKALCTEVSIIRTDHEGRVIEQLQGSPPVEYAIGQLGVNAKVTTYCRLPISSGFGLSAAALLSSIHATNHFFSLGLAPGECSGLAHEIEVVHNTGLGDVPACQGGGIDCRKEAGIAAGIIRLPPPPGPFYAITFGPLPSPGILGSVSLMEKVKSAFPGRCPESIVDFFKLSRVFAEKSGLITPEVRAALDTCDARGVASSMTMLGNGVFAYGKYARSVLSGMGDIFELRVATTGVHQAGYNFL